MSKLFVGIDVSLRKNNVRCMNSNGDTVRKFNVPNTLAGAQALVDYVAEAAALNSSQEVVLGLEATSNYGYHLASFFKNSIWFGCMIRNMPAFIGLSTMKPILINIREPSSLPQENWSGWFMLCCARTSFILSERGVIRRLP